MHNIVHLIGFTTETYYVARSYKRQICQCQTGKRNLPI